MAAIGALLSYEASLSLGEAIVYKNEAAINKTEAWDQWNFYQSKSNKENLAELGAQAAPPEPGSRGKPARHRTLRG